MLFILFFFFFQAEDGIRDVAVTGVQTCALPIYLKSGVGVFGVGMPGPGQAPILVDVGAERMFSRALDYLQTRPEIDAKRIVVQGRSWSGYWAAVLAYTEKDRLRGAVVHGVGIHEYYAPDWQKKSFSTREYLFDVYPARASVYGTKSMDEFLAYGPRLSLLARGMLERASAPMLLVNGERDSQQPIADLYLLMKHGDPKRSEEHTSELQSRLHLVCRLLLEKKKKILIHLFG